MNFFTFECVPQNTAALSLKVEDRLICVVFPSLKPLPLLMNVTADVCEIANHTHKW